MNARRRLVAFLAFLIVVIFLSVQYSYQIHNALSYVTRPLWDTPDGPRRLIPHYYAEGLAFDQKTCALHGWNARSQDVDVWDAVLFSTELELLEIRMHELDAVVDKFFIIESNRTFTGIPKPTLFADNRQRFARFERKIVYSLFPGRVPPSVEGAFDVEGQQRDAMTKLIRSRLSASSPPPLVIFSDVDEIPSAHSIRLLKACDFPSPLHLQLRNFIYSFEWPYGWGSWRAQVHQWRSDQTYYRHSRASDLALADAGWHCSFCFRTIEEFITKMKGFSHADRIGGDASLLSPQRIQKVICEGKDIFNMLPEAYSYKDMLSLMNPDSSKTAVGLPLYLLQHAEKFKFLLPGGCVRER